MKTLLALLISSLALQTSFACTCWGPDNFCETLDAGKPDAVFLIRKIADNIHGMEAEVIEVIAGTENRTNINIWGDPGHLCRIYTSTWIIGDTVIMALHKIGQYPYVAAEDSNDYYISACGTYFLNYQNEKVIGQITPQQDQMSYAEFKVSSSNCFTTGYKGPVQIDIDVWPVPFQDEINISVMDYYLPLDWNLFDIHGRLINHGEMKESWLQIQTNDLLPGMYLFSIENSNPRRILKLD